jgi:hypothetical protein
MIPIPDYISSQLRTHILSQCPAAQEGWIFANQDEDTLTEDFFGRMRTNWQTVNDYEWRFHYNTVRVEGEAHWKKPLVRTELSLHYRNSVTGRNYYKSLVFQAKKENNQIDLIQWNKMKRFFPNGNMIVSYGPNGYNSYVDNITNKASLCQTIATNFMNCIVGIEGLYYDHEDNKFIRPNNIPVSGTVDNELMIEVFKNL